MDKINYNRIYREVIYSGLTPTKVYSLYASQSPIGPYLLEVSDLTSDTRKWSMLLDNIIWDSAAIRYVISLIDKDNTNAKLP